MSAAPAADTLMPYAQPVEARIALALVSAILAAGYTISVCDDVVPSCGEWTVKRSLDRDAILAALATTGGDTLLVRKVDGTRVGFVALVWGNGADLMADWTSNETIDAICEPLLAIEE